jgi:hypothetical protein
MAHDWSARLSLPANISRTPSGQEISEAFERIPAAAKGNIRELSLLGLPFRKIEKTRSESNPVSTGNQQSPKRGVLLR